MSDRVGMLAWLGKVDTALVVDSSASVSQSACGGELARSLPRDQIDSSALKAAGQELTRAADMTAPEWALWRQIADEVAALYQMPPREQAALRQRLAEGDMLFMQFLLTEARAHGLPVTGRLEFWQLVYPGQYLLRIVTASHTCYLVIPPDQPGARLYHGATATIRQPS